MVRVLIHEDGPTYMGQPVKSGTIVDLPEAVAAYYLADNRGELAPEEKPVAKKVPAVETAEKPEPPENAAKRTSKPRARKGAK